MYNERRRTIFLLLVVVMKVAVQFFLKDDKFGLPRRNSISFRLHAGFKFLLLSVSWPAEEIFERIPVILRSRQVPAVVRLLSLSVSRRRLVLVFLVSAIFQYEATVL